MCALKKGYMREDILVPTFSGATDKEFIRNELTHENEAPRHIIYEANVLKVNTMRLPEMKVSTSVPSPSFNFGKWPCGRVDKNLEVKQDKRTDAKITESQSCSPSIV